MAGLDLKCGNVLLSAAAGAFGAAVRELTADTQRSGVGSGTGDGFQLLVIRQTQNRNAKTLIFAYSAQSQSVPARNNALESRKRNAPGNTRQTVEQRKGL